MYDGLAARALERPGRDRPIPQESATVTTTRTPEVQTAIDALVSLLARDAYLRERYGLDGDRCPIVTLRNGRTHCLFHDLPTTDPSAIVCADRIVR